MDIKKSTSFVVDASASHSMFCNCYVFGDTKVGIIFESAKVKRKKIINRVKKNYHRLEKSFSSL